MFVSFLVIFKFIYTARTSVPRPEQFIRVLIIFLSTDSAFVCTVAADRNLCPLHTRFCVVCLYGKCQTVNTDGAITQHFTQWLE